MHCYSMFEAGAMWSGVYVCFGVLAHVCVCVLVCAYVRGCVCYVVIGSFQWTVAPVMCVCVHLSVCVCVLSTGYSAR